MSKLRKSFALGMIGAFGTAILLVLVGDVLPTVAQPPKNVIILIGDGMGPEQVRAAGMYLNGAAGTLNFESFPGQGAVTTAAADSSADSSVTDSAAGATAIATGVRVNRQVISVALPGDGSDLPTILEIFKDQGKSTGLVTTVGLLDATPAAFAAHNESRFNNEEIAADYLNVTRPNVLLGSSGSSGFLTPTVINNDGNYTLVENRTELNALDSNNEPFVAGLFNSSGTSLPYEYDYDQGTSNGYDTLPHLSEMTGAALDLLDNDPDGFFLMVESGRIDHAGHSSNSNLTLKTGRAVFETIEFANAVQAVLDWASINDPGLAETLIIVTADHETGGLSVTETDPMVGMLPAVTWGSENHTGVNVPLAAIGVNSSLFTGVLDNTDLLALALIPEPSSLVMFALGGAALLARRRRLRNFSQCLCFDNI